MARELIYKDEARGAVLYEHPAITFCIDRLKPVDAVEVVHGKWLKVQEPLGCRDVDCVECSACHESWIIDEDYCFDDFGGWNSDWF